MYAPVPGSHFSQLLYGLCIAFAALVFFFFDAIKRFASWGSLLSHDEAYTDERKYVRGASAGFALILVALGAGVIGGVADTDTDDTDPYFDECVLYDLPAVRIACCCSVRLCGHTYLHQGFSTPTMWIVIALCVAGVLSFLALVFFLVRRGKSKHAKPGFSTPTTKLRDSRGAGDWGTL
jgi:hypothetical protein